MLCSVKKNMAEKYTAKSMDSLIFNIPLFWLMFAKWVVVKFWGGFITGLQIYKAKHRS